MVRWLRWHCPPDTGFEIRALAVWGRARYLSVTEAPHNTDFHTWMGKKHFCFFQTAETGNRTSNSGVKCSGANHYPRAPTHLIIMLSQQRRRWANIKAALGQGITLRITTVSYSRRAGALVQWLKLPAWKVRYRGFEPNSGLQVSKKQNVSSPLTRKVKSQRNKMFLPRSLIKIQYRVEPPRRRV